MKHIKLFNESVSDKKTFKNTDDDIKEFFIDYYDKGKLKIQNLVLENGIISKDVAYVNKSSNYRKCKLITINLGKADGAYLWNKRCITSVDVLAQALHDIQSFYDFLDEDVNYTIDNDYEGVSIKFVTLGDDIDRTNSLSDDIDSWMSSMKEVFKEKGFKRVSTNGNMLDITIPKTKGIRNAENIEYTIKTNLHRINRGEMTIDNTTDEGYLELINIRNEALQKGLKFELLGGDLQICIRFNNI